MSGTGSLAEIETTGAGAEARTGAERGGGVGTGTLLTDTERVGIETIIGETTAETTAGGMIVDATTGEETSAETSLARTAGKNEKTRDSGSTLPRRRRTNKKQ